MSIQRKLVSKKKLEILLQQIKPFTAPKPELEQYPLNAKDASLILTIIANTYNDIQGKTIGDLGCGTGILAIGAALLGAKLVFGVDIDEKALKIAGVNAEILKVSQKIKWIHQEIEQFSQSLDVVIQNPPFGVQKEDYGMDTIFLKHALKLAPTIYSLHKAGTKNQQFLSNFIQRHHANIDAIIPLEITIPHLFHFHTKNRYSVKVDLYRILSLE
ncbi:MAG: METTL5 family protein [Candidatus Helarchaeota archaeon]